MYIYKRRRQFTRQQFIRRNFKHLSGNAMVLLSLHDTIEVLHQRMGHISRHRIRRMIDKGLIDYDKADTDDFYTKHICRSCLSNKLRRPSYNRAIQKAKRPASRWYMDLTGPYTTTSINGNKFKLSLIDSHSNLAF